MGTGELNIQNIQPSMIKVTPQSIQLNLIQPIYKVKFIESESGHPIEQEKLVKELRVKKWFELTAISSVEECITSKNQIAKKRCVIYDRYAGKFYCAAHPPEEVAGIIFTHNQNPIGYNASISQRTTQIRKYRRK